MSIEKLFRLLYGQVVLNKFYPNFSSRCHQRHPLFWNELVSICDRETF